MIVNQPAGTVFGGKMSTVVGSASIHFWNEPIPYGPSLIVVSGTTFQPSISLTK